MGEYQKMIKSLIDPIRGFNLLNEEMVRKENEDRTVLTGRKEIPNQIPYCTSLGLGQDDLEAVKLLKRNSFCRVTLKKDKRIGKLYVEKLTEAKWEFDAEIDFYKNLVAEGQKYFPVITCQDESSWGKKRFIMLTEFIESQESSLAASRATEKQLKSMIRQLFESIVELHRIGFIHFDIHPKNVLVTEDFQIKLFDFGYAKPVGNVERIKEEPARFSACPELFDKSPGPVDVAIDWWSFGSTISTWYHRYYQQEGVKYGVLSLTDGIFDFVPMCSRKGMLIGGIFPESFSPIVRQFLALFLTIDPEFRFFDTVRIQETVRNHDFFNNQFDSKTK